MSSVFESTLQGEVKAAIDQIIVDAKQLSPEARERLKVKAALADERGEMLQYFHRTNHIRSRGGEVAGVWDAACAHDLGDVPDVRGIRWISELVAHTVQALLLRDELGEDMYGLMTGPWRSEFPEFDNFARIRWGVVGKCIGCCEPKEIKRWVKR